MCATSQNGSPRVETAAVRRARKALQDPASPRMVLGDDDLCAAASRPWRRLDFWTKVRGLIRPHWTGAVAWSGVGLLVFEVMAWWWPGLTINWAAILPVLIAVLVPLLSISLPIAAHTVSQRGRMVAEYYTASCRLHRLVWPALLGLLLGLSCLICFHLDFWGQIGCCLTSIGPSVALGLTLASLLGLTHVLLTTLACMEPAGRVQASRYLAARMAGTAIRGRTRGSAFSLPPGDLALMMADADTESFEMLVRSLASVPRLYMSFAREPDGLHLEMLWGLHTDIMANVLGRGAYAPTTSRPGPIAARFARVHAHVLADELLEAIESADPLNLGAATRTIKWVYGLLHSARGDESIPREVREAMYECRGRAALWYSLPARMLERLPPETTETDAADLIRILHHGMMSLLAEAAERKDHAVVDALAKGIAEFYSTAQKRLLDLGIAEAARLETYDYWILLGHFVTLGNDGAPGAVEAALALHAPLARKQPLELIQDFESLPEPTWEHPVYVLRFQAMDGEIRVNPLTGCGVGSACSVGHPGRELDVAFAFLLAKAWRMLQPAPAVVPCPRDVGAVKKQIEKVFDHADRWQLNARKAIDEKVICQWLDDCATAFREIEFQKYMATPLSPAKKAEFARELREGFWEGAVLVESVPGLLSTPDNAAAPPVRLWALHGPRSLFIDDEPDQDVASFGRDSGVRVASMLQCGVMSNWCGAVAQAPVQPVGLEDALRLAAEWLGPTGGWRGLIVVFGPYMMPARVQALKGYEPHPANTKYRQEFFGTYQEHPLAWLRTGEGNNTRMVFAFRLSTLDCRAEDGAVESAAPYQDTYPKAEFMEAAELAAEYRKAGREADAKEVEERPGDMWVLADVGRLCEATPEGRAWGVIDDNAT